MAGISFEEASGTQPKGISFEEASGVSAIPTSTPKTGVLEKSVQDYKQKQEDRVTGAGAFTSSYLESMGATPAALVGARTAMALPQPAWFKPVSGLTGGIVMGYLGSKGIDSLEGFVDQVFGTNIVETREKQRQQYPGYSLAGSVTGGVFNPFMRPGLPDTVKQAAIGSGVMTGVGISQRAIEGQPVLDPQSILIDAATGAFTKPTKLGERILGHTPPPAKPKSKGKDIPDAPPPGATPEQVEAFKKKVKEEKAKRDAKAPLVETAIRNKSTGEVERMGPKHDEARKEQIGLITLSEKTLDEIVAPWSDLPQEQQDLIRRYAQLTHEVSAAEKSSDPKTWTPEERAAYDRGDTEEFSRLRGYSKDDIKKYQEWQKLSREVINLLGEDEAFGIIYFLNERYPYSHEAGFVDERGNFHTREQAVDQAKRAGQIPEDHVLENPLGEQPGLHSGDLRKAGDERFAITEDQQKIDSKEAAEDDFELFTDGSVWMPANKPPYEGAKKSEDGFWLSRDGKYTVYPVGGYGFKVVQLDTARFLEKNGIGSAHPNTEVIKIFEAIREGKDPTAAHEELIKQLNEFAKTPEDRAEGKAVADNVLQKAKEHFATLKDQPSGVPKEEVTTPSSPDELASKTSKPVAKAFEKVDPRSVPNEEEMIKHATDIYERFGEDETVKFFDDYQKNLNERSIPVPDTVKELDDALHKVNTFESKDRSEHVVGYKENTDKGVTAEDRARWFDMRERGEELPPEAKAILDDLDAENIALVRKIKAMGGDVGEEFVTGQSRIRLFSEKEKPGWKETIKEFFSNKMSFGDKVADQADAAIERKVFQTDDGRVIEFHRQPEDVTTPRGEIKKGTQIFEWKDGQRRLIGYSEDLNFKRGDKFVATDGKELTVVDGKVPDIERHSPYRYWHDAEASARLANMGLRKMARELELVNNLKQSKLFETVGFSPDKPIKDLPKGWVVPSNIDRIPELRGWHFDPKTAAIISDFAKVWDNTMWMKLTNAVVKNMMLNPIPHIFNEVMHLWNARGFSGWVDPRQLGTFADTARLAWRDVGNQTQFYRDIMREGGSILGADPRNKHFEVLQKEAQKEMFGTPEMQRSMTQLAKKLGTSVGDLYNGISNASQKAMWFTRDVMYVQLIREIMARQEKSTGVRMELKDAIAQAERHMPNYRMPSEVLGSRGLAWTLKNPNIALFSRYHYGMVKSLVNTIKDVDPRNLRTPEGRAHFREGVDSMLAIGVAMGMLYPVMDDMAQAVFGEGAEQRRAGPYHLLKAGLDVYENKKDVSALIWPVFTFNPVLLTLGQLGLNKKIFTGKPIYHPDDEFEDIASDVGEYAVKQMPQAAPVMSATAEEGGDTKLLARQFDIKAKTEADLAAEKRAEERRIRAKKSRDTKRAKGTYKP